MNSSSPLSGVRVLDVATMLAAPFCATFLGEFGAEVIKLEVPGQGDGFRRFGTQSAAGSYNWLNENRNKKSVTLDLRTPQGQEIFRGLIAHCDILVENFRPGTLEKWNLGYDELKRIKPELILVSVTAYGQTGPRRDRPGFARLAHAFAGFAHTTGEAEGPPLMPGALSLGDYVTGMYATMGALVAYIARSRFGFGQAVDVSLYESMFRVMDEMVSVYASKGFVRGRMGAEVSNVVPHSHYPTADGKWVAIACSTDRMFERLAEAMGRVDLLERGAFATMQLRLAKRDELNGLIAAWTRSFDRDALVAHAIAHDVPVAEVYDVADIFADEHFRARRTFVEYKDSRVGTVVGPNVFPKLSVTPGAVHSLGPDLGQHNREIYTDLLGIPPQRLDELVAQGVI